MHAGGPELVAAVSNAGGLGVLSSAGISSEQMEKNIAATRKLTKKPFAVNIQASVAEFAQSRAKLAIDEGIKIVTLGRIDPEIPVISLLKKKDVTVMTVVGNTSRALSCEEQGADIIIASGREAGGHIGRVSTMPLIPAVVDAVKIPVIAAGGIADARGFVAALALGACGIQMGTRFYATKEANASTGGKNKIIASSEDGTIVTTALTGAPCRLIREKALDEWEGKRQQGASKEELKALSAEIQKKYWQKLEGAVVSAGQASGVIKSILSVEEVIEQIINEATVICNELNKAAK